MSARLQVNEELRIPAIPGIGYGSCFSMQPPIDGMQASTYNLAIANHNRSYQRIGAHFPSAPAGHTESHAHKTIFISTDHHRYSPAVISTSAVHYKDVELPAGP